MDVLRMAMIGASLKNLRKMDGRRRLEKKKKNLDDFFSIRSCPWLPDAYYPARNPGGFDAELRNSWSRDVNHQMARSFSRN